MYPRTPGVYANHAAHQDLYAGMTSDPIKSVGFVGHVRHTLAALGFFDGAPLNNAWVARKRSACALVSALAAGSCAAPQSCSTAHARALSMATAPPSLPPSPVSAASPSTAPRNAARSWVTYS